MTTSASSAWITSECRKAETKKILSLAEEDFERNDFRFLFLHELDDARFFRAAAQTFVEDFLAQTQVLRRGFHEFIHVNVFKRAFQRELHRRRKGNAFAVALRTHVGEAF